MNRKQLSPTKSTTSKANGTVHFSRRELQVARMTSLSNKEIAYRLGLTKGTVVQYLHSAFVKAKVSSRTELAVLVDAPFLR